MHLAGCPGCSQKLDGLSSLIQDLRRVASVEAEQFVASGDLKQMDPGGVRAAHTVAPGRPFLQRMLRIAPLLAAVAVAAVVATLLYGIRSDQVRAQSVISDLLDRIAQLEKSQKDLPFDIRDAVSPVIEGVADEAGMRDRELSKSIQFLAEHMAAARQADHTFFRTALEDTRDSVGLTQNAVLEVASRIP